VSGDFDLAILGSGFAGALLAMVARRLGLTVLLLERGTHPRFAIGESTSPLTNLLLEELAQEYDLPRLLPFTTYGTWKRAYPEVTVGLKRGFSFYFHPAGQPFGPDPQRARQLLVAASPENEVADTHWYRAEFDHFLVREAQSLGAEYIDRVRIDRLEREGEISTLSGHRAGREVAYRARFVVDATGPRGALSRLLGLPEAPFEGLPSTQALFTHFTGVGRFESLAARDGESPPYPPDDAALHHVFDGGWMWVLRFENGITSAGFAVEDGLAEELRLEEKEEAWGRFLACFPSIRQQFASAVPVLPFVHAPRLSYRCLQQTGPGWALLPSAAAFVDPLFSTGFPLTLLGIHRLGRALRESWGRREFELRLREYADVTDREARTAARLVGGCYRTFADFPAFAALSMLYFVAASYSEMARRLGRPDLASEFLLQNRPSFRDAFCRHCSAAWRGTPSAFAAIAADLEPFNIAGLCEPSKRNWYGVDLNDVVRGAFKLEQSPEAVQAFFAQMGWC
jgi:tetracycline 7-halogenase / FADH2 O2-dependent halogenase